MASIDAVANLDANGNIKTNLPLIPAQAGHAQIAFMRSSTALARVAKISDEGELRVVQTARLFSSRYNGAAAGGLVNNQWSQMGTTMAVALNGGYVRMNSGLITTINTGVALYTNQVFSVIDMSSLKISQSIRTGVGSAALPNKQMDFGFGMYVVAANHAGPMVEFVGFRWTIAGALIGVVEYSTGGVANTVTVTLPLQTDSVDHNYEIILSESLAEFYIDGSLVGSIVAQADAPSLTKGATYPVVNRLFIGATLPSSAPTFDIGTTVVCRIGGAIVEHDRNTLQLLSGRDLLKNQAGIHAGYGNQVSRPASGTQPSALVPNNTTVSALVGLGGYARATITGITATIHSELIMCSFQNPNIPIASGAVTDGRSFLITDIMISPLIVSVILAGGGFTAEWFAAYGSSAISLVTADAVGVANLGTKSPVIVPMPIFDTLAATAAVGTIAARSGEAGHIALNTPIPVHPGEFFHLGLRTLFVAAAITAGALDYAVGLRGVWVE